MSPQGYDRIFALATNPFYNLLSTDSPDYFALGVCSARDGPVSPEGDAPPPYSPCVEKLNDMTESLHDPAVDTSANPLLPLYLDSKIPIAYDAEVLRILLKPSGVDLSQIRGADSSGEENFLGCKRIASIRFACGRNVEYVLTRVDDNLIIIGTWVEPVYGKMDFKKAVRNFVDALNWPASEIKSAREVHQREFYSYLTTDFQRIPNRSHR